MKEARRRLDVGQQVLEAGVAVVIDGHRLGRRHTAQHIARRAVVEGEVVAPVRVVADVFEQAVRGKRDVEAVVAIASLEADVGGGDVLGQPVGQQSVVGVLEDDVTHPSVTHAFIHEDAVVAGLVEVPCVREVGKANAQVLHADLFDSRCGPHGRRPLWAHIEAQWLRQGQGVARDFGDLHGPLKAKRDLVAACSGFGLIVVQVPAQGARVVVHPSHGDPVPGRNRRGLGHREGAVPADGGLGHCGELGRRDGGLVPEKAAIPRPLGRRASHVGQAGIDEERRLVGTLATQHDTAVVQLEHVGHAVGARWKEHRPIRGRGNCSSDGLGVVGDPVPNRAVVAYVADDRDLWQRGLAGVVARIRKIGQSTGRVPQLAMASPQLRGAGERCRGEQEDEQFGDLVGKKGQTGGASRTPHLRAA